MFDYRYDFDRCSSELAELVPISYFHWRFSSYYNTLHDFSPAISKVKRVKRVTMLTASFLAKVYSTILPAECFPSAYDLNGFKSRVKRHLLYLASI